MSKFTKAELVIKLVESGFKVESAREFVKSGNVDNLEHTGWYRMPLYQPSESLK